MVSRRPLRAVAILVVLAASGAAQPAEETEGAASAGTRVAELSRSLEQQARELFLSVSGGTSASEPLLLHAHNFMGAARSFAHLVADVPQDAELLRLSFSLLERESELLAPLLPGVVKEGAFASVASLMDAIDAQLIGVASSPDEEDSTRPRITLETDGWHGNLLDRFLRVTGSLEGVGLERCDAVITDSRNHIAWSEEDVVREIDAHYRARPWQRPEPAKIRFSLRLPADRFADGANFITFTLTDGDGRQAVDTVAVGK